MTIPTINDVQGVEPILTNMLVAYMNTEDRYVATRAFPVVQVEKDSGKFWKFTKKYWFQSEMKKRAPGQQYARAGFGVETDTYETLQWALANAIADETRKNSQLPMDLETAAVKWLGQQSLLRKEISWATDFMVTGVWGTTQAGSAVSGAAFCKWSDYTGSDPITDVLTARRTVSQNTGKDVNTWVLGEIVRDRLINHPDLLDRIKYTTAAGVGSVESALAAIFNIPSVLVARAIYSATNEGQTATYSPIVDDDCLLLYANPAPSIFEASGGYTFAWNGGGGTGVIMSNRDDLNDADLVKIKEQWDQKVVASDLGYLMTDIVD